MGARARRADAGVDGDRDRAGERGPARAGPPAGTGIGTGGDEGAEGDDGRGGDCGGAGAGAGAAAGHDCPRTISARWTAATMRSSSSTSPRVATSSRLMRVPSAQHRATRLMTLYALCVVPFSRARARAQRKDMPQNRWLPSRKLCSIRRAANERTTSAVCVVLRRRLTHAPVDGRTLDINE
jgi:hypothetical protein